MLRSKVAEGESFVVIGRCGEQVDHAGDRFRHIGGQITAVRAGIGQQLLFIEALGVVKGLLRIFRCGLFRFCFQNRPPFTRKVISGFLMLTLVSLSTDSVRKAVPPMTTLSPTSVAPPSSVAPA